ncbi:unnamed protein product [Cylicocyclus nassatus]|uniref:MurNAc-LAA domain-containing protein n=1 Tax=Cylicocyclus nassatus TaxID=53992 RepID=A0AA36M3P3_CYLNA|nr:unnamed protein product [Cylicocyclus nassatus]
MKAWINAHVDKILHALVCYAIMTILVPFVGFDWGVLLTVLVAIGKETYDLQDYGLFSWGDVVADLVGIDNGHGSDTPGKCSPDGLFQEWKYTREIAQMVVRCLVDQDIDARLLTPEKYDVSLKARVARANDVCLKYGKNNVILISVHVDAAGADGKWHNAGGWSAYTSKGKTRSDEIAEFLYKAADTSLVKYAELMQEGKKTNLYSKSQTVLRKDQTDGDSDKEENFYILKNSLCPAVLTENLFQDSSEDVKFLLSEEGRVAIVRLHKILRTTADVCNVSSDDIIDGSRKEDVVTARTICVFWCSAAGFSVESLVQCTEVNNAYSINAVKARIEEYWVDRFAFHMLCREVGKRLLEYAHSIDEDFDMELPLRRIAKVTGKY